MTTYTILNVQKQYAEDVPVYRPDFINWALIDTKDDGKGNKEATYQMMAFDPAHPSSIRLGCYEKGQRANVSTKGTTVVAVDPSEGSDPSVVTYEELVVTVAISGPKGILANRDADIFAQNVILFAGVGVQALATPALSTLAGAAPGNLELYAHDRLKFGIPQFDPSEMGSPATA